MLLDLKTVIVHHVYLVVNIWTAQNQNVNIGDLGRECGMDDISTDMDIT
jgi:hypothetical protein